jgi:mannose-6-phosphate isomerase-like protein (cupin superfamily)
MVTPGESGFDPRGTFVFLEDGGAGVPVEVTPTFWQELIRGETASATIRRIRDGDGWLTGAYSLSASGGWEMHPAGDELLYLLSGAMDVVLQAGGGDRVVELRPGTACIVPRGVWHRQIVHQPGDLFAITYGKGTHHRPL